MESKKGQIKAFKVVDEIIPNKITCKYQHGAFVFVSRYKTIFCFY